ncbi:MAG: ABC transporter permease [Thermoflexales bacterium]|nr:ABC transporter permease [Thermoflexales bacterium]
MIKVLAFARKTLLEYLREPLLWGLVLVFPPLMVAIMYFAFGSPQQSLARTLRVLVVDQDPGTPTRQAGSELVQAMRDLRFEGQPVFRVDELDDVQTARIILQENKAALLLVIPPDFSQALARDASRSAPVELSLVDDQASFSAIFAKSFLLDLLRAFVSPPGEQLPSEAVSYEFIPGTGTLSDFDFMTPGMVVFGVLFLSVSTATTLVRENVADTLKRLRLTRAHAGHMLLGVALVQVLVAALQVPLAFGTALACGWGSGGKVTPAALAGATGIGVLFSLSVIGVGLMVAAFARNDGDATNLATIPLVLMAFLSGAMYPMPGAPLFNIGGQTVSLYDIMPSTHAAEAMRRVVVYGDGPGGIVYYLLMLVLLAVVYVGVGIWLYQRFRLKNV